MIAGLVSGTLARDPETRTSASGKSYATGSIRSGSGDDAVFVSLIAFGEQAERLTGLCKGDAVSAGGRMELKSWTGRDGSERHGLSLVANEIAAARPRPRRRSNGASQQQPARDDRPPLDDPLPW